MSITVEQYFTQSLANQARIIELLSGGATVADAGKSTSTGKGTAAGKGAAAGKGKAAAKISKSQAADAVNKVKDTIGVDAAKALMKEFGVAKLATMEDEQIEPIYNAAMQALADAENGEEEEEEEGEDL